MGAKNKTSDGSYSKNNVSDLTKDLYRLKMQAKIARTLEKQLLIEAGIKGGMRVLDLGCGPGIVSLMVARLVSGGQVVGVDNNPDFLNYAKKIKAEEGVSNLELLEGDAYDLKFEENSFDFVYARFVFQHLRDPQKVVENVYRILKPGGIFCIADSDTDWWTIYPAPEGIEAFKQKAIMIQERKGGDKRVGRKLSSYLIGSSFEEVKTQVKVITSYDVGMDNFLDLTMGYKNIIASEGDAESFDTWQSKYTKLIKDQSAHGFAGIFVCTGIKPG